MKRIVWVILLLGITVLFCGCDREESGSPEELKTTADVLMMPVPEKGEKVAEINGCDYLYDREYLFCLFYQYFPEEPVTKDVNTAVLTELYVIEAKSLGLTFTEEEYDNQMENWQQTIAYLDNGIEENNQLLERGGEEISEDERDTINEEINRYQDNKTNIELIQKAIMTEENINDEEFWEREKPYLEKYLYAMAYTNKIYHDFYDDRDDTSSEMWSVYFNKITEDLKEKYNVKIFIKE